MMINIAETVRKTMGWCPDAGAFEVRKTSVFENLTINAPPGDAGSTYITPRWWNKYHKLVLLVSICLTILSIKWFILPEINKLDFVLAVVFTGILFRVLTWISGYDSWSKIASSETPVKPSMKRAIAIYILIISSVILFVYFWFIYGWKGIPGYFIGFLLVSWSWYLHILYWEKKNRKMIVTYGYFKPSVAAINPGDKR